MPINQRPKQVFFITLADRMGFFENKKSADTNRAIKCM